MADSPTIQFSWLQYDVAEIEQLIAANPGIDSFVFTYFFSGTSEAFGLASYIHLSEPDIYDKNYTMLPVYTDEEPMEFSGPVQLCDNVLPISNMENAIVNAKNEKADFLLFCPAMNDNGYIYYIVMPYQNAPQGKPHRLHGGNDEDTNPSPPAT